MVNVWYLSPQQAVITIWTKKSGRYLPKPTCRYVFYMTGLRVAGWTAIGRRRFARSLTGFCQWESVKPRRIFGLYGLGQIRNKITIDSAMLESALGGCADHEV